MGDLKLISKLLDPNQRQQIKTFIEFKVFGHGSKTLRFGFLTRMIAEYLIYLTYVQICDVTCIRTLYVDYSNDVSDDIDDKDVNNHR